MTKEDRPKRPVADAPKLPPEASDAVAGRVRASYAALLEEPIPEKFLKLLDDLDAASGRDDNAAGHGQAENTITVDMPVLPSTDTQSKG